ncbi:tail fiber domain-containing protein [Escherichia coli]|uniref:tail fiber domain-containing protein n=1 Tax=Escherichia coli TaxID=562 RepID=UPI0039C8C41A
MLYNTGTIAINGNSATGTGTNWTAPASQVRAGQTIIVMSNPVQLFQISSVNSATSMTVTPAASPALSGQKYGILVSDIISVDGLAQAMSQLIKEYDENIGAWETFATTSANQSITVTINGTSVTIPGIGKLAQKGSNGALPIGQGGTGATTAADARTNLNVPNLGGSNEFPGIQTFNDMIKVKTSATGGNAHLWFFDGDNNKSRGVIFASPSSTGRISIRPDSGSEGYSYSFDSAGKFTCATLSQTSDERLKKGIKQVTGALDKLMQLRGLTYQLRVTQDTWVDGAGVLAQELEKVLPCAVAISGEGVDSEGNTIQDAKSVDYSALSALYVEAFKELSSRLVSIENELKIMRGDEAS